MPRVLVLIVQAANGSTVELIRRLRAQAPATGIVVLTGQDAPTFADTVMDLGVTGYVLTDEAEGELPYAIRSAANGVAYVSPPVAVQLEALRRVSGADGLSVRETEVLRLIALGFTASEIADQLYLSQRTIETHRSHICEKLGLDKRWELVRYALSRHLIGDPDTVAWERARTGDGRIRNRESRSGTRSHRPRVRARRGGSGGRRPSPACPGAHDSAPQGQRSERPPRGPSVRWQFPASPNHCPVGLHRAVSARGNVRHETAARNATSHADQHGHNCPSALAMQQCGGADLAAGLHR